LFSIVLEKPDRRFYFNGEGFLLGDGSGGLSYTLRDDMSETLCLRKSSGVAVGDLRQLDRRHAALAGGDCRFEIIELVTETANIQAGIHVAHSFQLPSLGLTPAVGVVEEKTLLFATAADSLWIWQESTAPKQWMSCKQRADGRGEHGQCHLVTLSVSSNAYLAVTASSLGLEIQWWSIQSQEAKATGTSLGDASVLNLSSSLSFVLSLHSNGSICFWHGPSQSMALRLEPGISQVIQTAAAFDGCSLAVGSIRTMGAAQGILQLAGHDEGKEEEKPKDPKKIKPPKMFANKSRGGRKNQLRAAGKSA